MTLANKQVSVGSLVLGEGTPYRLTDFNPWSRQSRADQGDARAWNHGAWSGAEFQAEAVVPLRIVVETASQAAWTAAHQTLLAAFAASSTSVELRWMLDGTTEYVMFGRPRMVEPDIKTIGLGYAVTRAAFVGLDPLVYSGTEHSSGTGLPVSTGGLTLPVTAPFSIGATVSVGRVAISNAGTAPTGLRLRINGPVQAPRVALLTNAGTYTVSFFLDLSTGQWLDVDTAARTVYLNGTASRRNFAAVSDLGWPELPSGTAELAFFASAYDAAADLDVFWRDAYW